MESKNTISALVIILVIIGGVAFYLNKAPSMGNKNSVTAPVKTSTGLVAGLVVGSVKSAALGEYLTDTKGMTLYVFADDKKLESSCAGECLKTWPAFVYDGKDIKSATDMLSKRMNVAKRSDGTYQYAYGEKPVYYYVGDKSPSETNGNGMNNGKWSIVLITK